MRFSATKLGLLLCITLLTALLAGCGHPASEQECEAIIDRIIELELEKQNVKDPAQIEQRKVEARKARGAELMSRCKGRRVTDASIACIKSAKSYEQIDNVCLR